MLQIHDLSFSYSDQDIIIQHLHLSWQLERCGLVGPNGSGKSTLLSLLAGHLQPTAGQIVYDERPILFLPQNFPFSHAPLAHLIGDNGRILLAARRLSSGNAQVEDWELCDGRWETIELLERQLDRWEVGDLDLEQDLANFSSGTLQRLRLANLLSRSDALLLLDEPSNHLDRSGRIILYEALAQHRSGLLVASHDRELLHGVDRIIEFRSGSCISYGGNFNFYKKIKTQHEESAEAKFAAADQSFRKARRLAQASRERQEHRSAQGKANRDTGIPRIALGMMKRKAQKTQARLEGQHEEKIKRLEEQKETLRAEVHEKIELHFDLEAQRSRGSGPIIAVKNLNFSFDVEGPSLWSKSLNFEVHRGERLAILGDNGTGKSTLLRLLLAQILPTEGQILNRSKSWLYLNQDLDHLQDDSSLSQQWQNEEYIADEGLRRTMAARLGLSREKVFQSFGSMSGGERMRAALILLASLQVKPELIILDEPSNHLDIDVQQSLIETLNQLPCCLIIVSHDQIFRQELNVSNEIDLGLYQF